MQLALDIDGFCSGPLFAPLIKTPAPKLISGFDGSRRIWGMRRRASERKATPPWADQGLIRDLFKLARIYTETLGVTHSVDHRVPLTHRIVCGLHTPANLEVVPLAENVRKSNNWWPDMPETQGELL